jgi:hypothetical protein
LDFQRLILLASYWEFTGKRPESTDPASQNHMTLLQGTATEAKLLLGRKGEDKNQVLNARFLLFLKIRHRAC